MRAVLWAAAAAMAGAAPGAAQGPAAAPARIDYGDVMKACVPQTYEQSLDCLDRALGGYFADRMREKGVNEAPVGLMMVMIDEWDGVPGRALMQDMRRRGFTNPDDSRNAILDGYVARLRGTPYDLAAQAKKRRAYWRDIRSGKINCSDEGLSRVDPDEASAACVDSVGVDLEKFSKGRTK